MARIWVTNRFGLHPASLGTSPGTESSFGESLPPYDRLNLGLKVGDDPERVSANRVALAHACGLDEVIFMDQIHSNLMLDARDGAESKCDGIYLAKSSMGDRMGLGVQVADCVPLVLTHSKVIAAVHIGREGLVKGMTEVAIEKVATMADLDQLEAVIGPSICGDCYPLSREIFQECADRYPNSVFDESEFKVDVASAVASILESKGIAWHYSAGERECVSCDRKYFSYRREKVTGRQAMIVSW